MPVTPVKKGREVFAQLPNGMDATKRQEHPGVGKMTLNDDKEGAKLSVLVQPGMKKTANFPIASPSVMRRPSLSNAANKRSRPSPHMKRVSFGGDTIKIIEQHVNEFATPPSQVCSPSPPRKSLKGSIQSSPAPAPAPMFARTSPDLLMGGEDANDESMSIPDGSKAVADVAVEEEQDTSFPMDERPFSRGGIRESFGMFLDTDVGTGLRDYHTRGESEHTASLMPINTDAMDSPEDSDGDMTQNIVGISQRAEDDEAADDNDGLPMSQIMHGSTEEEERLDSSRRMSVRKSLPYFADLNSANDSGFLPRNKDRCSMAPIAEAEHNIRLELSPANNISPGDATYRIPAPSALLEDDDTMEINTARSVSTVIEVREKLPDNRQLFDSGEEPTIHFHDEIQPVMSAAPVSLETQSNEQDTSEIRSKQVGIEPENGDSNISKPSAALPPKPPQAENVRKSILKNPTQSKATLRETEKQYAPKIQEDDQERDETEGPSGAVMSTPAASSPLLRRAMQGTPGSVGSMVRAVKERTPIAAQLGTDEQLRELSDSVLKSSSGQERVKSSTAGPSDTVLKNSSLQEQTKASKARPIEKEFSINDFLGAAKIRFDDQIAVDPRKPSLAPMHASLADLDAPVPQRQLLESVKKERILTKLQNEVTKFLDMVDKSVESIKSTERSIERERPPVFAKLTSAEDLSADEMTNLQYSLKKLQKVMFRHVRLDWVKRRQSWEEKICEELGDTIVSMESDAESLVASQKVYDRARGQVESIITSNGIDTAETTHGVSHELDVDSLRQDARNEHSNVLGFVADVGILTSQEASLLTSRENLLTRRKELLAQQKQLQTYGGGKAVKKLRHVLTERQKLNGIVCRVVGMMPYFISSRSLRACLGELMDVNITIGDDKVSSVETTAVANSRNLPHASLDFIRGSVEVVGQHLKRAASVRELPFAVRGCAEQLLFARKMLSDANYYFERHLGEIKSAEVRQGPQPCLDLSILGSFYSLTLKVKFDILFRISTSFPAPTSTSSISQQVGDISIVRFIGNTPHDQELRNALTLRGFEQTPDRFNLSHAFSGIWQLLR